MPPTPNSVAVEFFRLLGRIEGATKALRALKTFPTSGPDLALARRQLARVQDSADAALMLLDISE